MRRRHWMLIPSFALAAAVYYGVYTIAPDIVLLAANAALPDVESRFQVQYRDIPQARPEVRAPVETVEDLSAAPESIRELMNETLGPPPMDLAPPEPVEIPDAAERLAQESLTRTHDFAFPEGTLQSIETDLLQISERAAREQIEIARRFVDPVDTRLLEGGAVPS